jgi:hypothetical protein
MIEWFGESSYDNAFWEETEDGEKNLGGLYFTHYNKSCVNTNATHIQDGAVKAAQ